VKIQYFRRSDNSSSNWCERYKGWIWIVGKCYKMEFKGVRNESNSVSDGNINRVWSEVNEIPSRRLKVLISIFGQLIKDI
jgi:hypothetical protein